MYDTYEVFGLIKKDVTKRMLTLDITWPDFHHTVVTLTLGVRKTEGCNSVPGSA